MVAPSSSSSPSSSSPSSSSLSSTTIKVPLAAGVEEMWPALKNAVNIIAQYCPQFIHSCNLLHGDGGLGSIRLVKFGPASGLVTYAKEEIVQVDEEKMVLTYLLLEGDLKKQFKVFKPTISLEKVATSGKGHEPKEEEVPTSKESLENNGGGITQSDRSPDEKDDDIVLTSKNVHKEEEEQQQQEKEEEEKEEKVASSGQQGAPEGGFETVATWKLEYEVEEGVPPPQIDLLNEGAKMFLKLLEASLEASKTRTDLDSTSPVPVKEQAPSPTPLVA